MKGRCFGVEPEELSSGCFDEVRGGLDLAGDCVDVSPCSFEGCAFEVWCGSSGCVDEVDGLDCSLDRGRTRQSEQGVGLIRYWFAFDGEVPDFVECFIAPGSGLVDQCGRFCGCVCARGRSARVDRSPLGVLPPARSMKVWITPAATPTAIAALGCAHRSGSGTR